MKLAVFDDFRLGMVEGDAVPDSTAPGDTAKMTIEPVGEMSLPVRKQPERSSRAP